MSVFFPTWLPLIYGSGIRLMECIRLRIQDVDFGQGQIYVRDGKAGKDRTTYLPKMIADELSQHIERVKNLHQQDLDEGFGAVYLPNALAKKYKKAAKETGWQYVVMRKDIHRMQNPLDRLYND